MLLLKKIWASPFCTDSLCTAPWTICHSCIIRVSVVFIIVSLMPKPSKIYPTLFIGDLKNAEDVDSLFDLGITHVLSVGAGTSQNLCYI